MLARTKDHGVALVKKHNITLHGAFVPTRNPNGQMITVLSHASAEARKANWKAFSEDEEWKKVVADSEKDGKVTAKVDVLLLKSTDYSPDISALKKSETPRVFELRTYTATPNNLKLLNGRFREHTMKLFEKYGMTNVVYWNLIEGEAKADVTLVYLLAHDTDAARQKSFDEFRKDPNWIAAREASEKAGGGSLTEPKDGVLSLVLEPLPFSPIK